MSDKFKNYDGPDPLAFSCKPGNSDVIEGIVETPSQPGYTAVCILKDSKDRTISVTKPFKVKGNILWKFSVDFSHVILDEQEDYVFGVELAGFWSWPKFFWYGFKNLIKRILIKKEIDYDDY